MKYTVRVFEEALKGMKKWRKTDREKVLSGLRALADNPRPEGAVKIHGKKNSWRVRLFDVYRATYEVRDEELLVLVLEIKPRGSAYRKFN
jgi:mRNA interferase RelE/StbE